jgi:predicted RNase H-like nuclease (RuvC/YqgF family)
MGAILTFILFCWLNWWVMPDLAILRFMEKGTLMPETCYVLLEEEHNRLIGHRVIESLKSDWSGVPAAWPYVVVGVIIGLGIGYVIGELARRKFAIEEASREAIEKADHILTEAVKRDGQAEGKLLQAASREKDALYLQNVLQEELEACRTATEAAEEKKRIYEEKLGDAVKTERELDKAKKAIEKLERQIARLKKDND